MKKKIAIVALVTLFVFAASMLVACGEQLEPITVTLDATASTYVDESVRLTANTSRKAENGEKLEWSTSDASVATVNNGTVSGKGEGTAVITVKIGESSASCTVQVGAKRTVTLDVTTANVNLDEDEPTFTITATSAYPITWSSANRDVATVENGVVTCKQKGTATISATITGSNISATCNVTVTQPSAPYTLERSNNATVVANPGIWYWFAKGADSYELAADPTYDGANKTMTLSFAAINTANMEYYFRYQPTFEVGTSYTVSFKITLSHAGTVRIQGEDYQFEEGESETITVTSTVDASYPFTIRPLIYGATAEDPVTITLSEVEFVPNTAAE